MKYVFAAYVVLVLCLGTALYDINSHTWHLVKLSNGNYEIEACHPISGCDKPSPYSDGYDLDTATRVYELLAHPVELTVVEVIK